MSIHQSSNYLRGNGVGGGSTTVIIGVQKADQIVRELIDLEL